VTCVCVINSMLVSDLLFSQYMHPAGWCAPFLGSPLATQMSWISTAPVLARSLRNRWSCDCEGQESKWYNCQWCGFEKRSLLPNQPPGCRELGTGDCECIFKSIFVCTYLPNPFMCHCMLKGERHHASKTHHANKQHESSCPIFCSSSFLPFCVRICRIITRTSLACEVAMI
jgi:hypothetical protein